MTIGQRIRQIREQREWSITDLGNRLGSRSYVYQVECDESSPTLGWLEKAAAAFGISVLELLAPVYEDQPAIDEAWEEVNMDIHAIEDTLRALSRGVGILARDAMRRRHLQPVPALSRSSRQESE